MKLFDVDTIEEAKAKIKNVVGEKLLRKKTVSVFNSLGMVCAEDVLSAIDVPGFLRSTVDGYAVIARDTQGAGESIPTFLKVTGEIAMGEKAEGKIVSGQCMYVPTGGMLPKGADAVVMVEYCEHFGAADIAVYDAVSYGRNTIEKGEDTHRGETVISRGTVMRAQDIGAAASCGITEISVYEPLRISVISTGDEIVSPEGKLTEGKIYDINTYSISSLARRKGYEVVYKTVVPDDETLLRETIAKAMEKSDIVCVSGGSSQGKKDMTSTLIDSLATPGVFTHGLALKPGKPTILGYDTVSDTFLCGLPGHPVAAMMVFELVLCDTFDELRGVRKPFLIDAVMEKNIACDAGKANCIPVKLLETDKGYTARPVQGKSGLISTLTQSDGYIVTGHNLEGIKENEAVKVRLFDR